MKKKALKKLKLNKKMIAGMTAEKVQGGLSGFCNPSDENPQNPMDSNYRSVCIGCEESMGIIC